MFCKSKMSREDRQKRKLKFYNKWEDALEVRLAGVKAAKAKIEVENMKIKVDEMFGSLDGADPLGTITLRNEIASIKQSLANHGIN